MFLQSNNKYTLGNETCDEHWNVQSSAAGNPDINNLVPSKSSITPLVFKEVLRSFSKVNTFAVTFTYVYMYMCVQHLPS